MFMDSDRWFYTQKASGERSADYNKGRGVSQPPN
jgi:hypothetical protein